MLINFRYNVKSTISGIVKTLEFVRKKINYLPHLPTSWRGPCSTIHSKLIGPLQLPVNIILLLLPPHATQAVLSTITHLYTIGACFSKLPIFNCIFISCNTLSILFSRILTFFCFCPKLPTLIIVTDNYFR